MTMIKVKWLSISIVVVVCILLLLFIGIKIMKYAAIALISAAIGAGFTYFFMNKNVKAAEEDISKALTATD